MQNFDNDYKNITRRITTFGAWRDNRTGMRTKAVPSSMVVHDFINGFPLLTLKHVPLRIVAVELEGFLKGITDKSWYEERGCNIWSAWTNPEIVPYGTSAATQQAMRESRDLGPIYGYQWRAFDRPYQPVPQLPTGIKPTVQGVAFFDGTTEPFAAELKTVWYNMIYRCYNPENKDYQNYGGRGVYVANSWLVFSQFVKDVQQLDNWSEKLKNWLGWSLDKDLKSGICYSKETCLWSTHSKQCRHTGQIQKIKATHKSGEVREFECLADCAAFLNSHPTNICKALAGKYPHVQHWTFERLGQKRKINPGVDQLQMILDTLLSDPDSRRMVCSAWNPGQLSQQALPPCHILWQVLRIDGKLHLNWYQRSADWFLGVPFDMASYALLLLLLSKHAGLPVGTITGFFGDTHFYENQLDGAKEILCRSVRTAPSVKLTHEDFWSWDHSKILVSGYDPHPSIKVPVVV